MAETRTCKDCNHWKPKYHGVGVCTAEGMPNAKFWVAEQKELLTVGTFSCQSFAEKQDPQKEMI